MCVPCLILTVQALSIPDGDMALEQLREELKVLSSAFFTLYKKKQLSLKALHVGYMCRVSSHFREHGVS